MAQACDEASSPAFHACLKIHPGTLGIMSHIFIIFREMIMAFFFPGNRLGSSFWMVGVRSLTTLF